MSVDHGTAPDIALKNQADYMGCLYVVRLAIDKERKSVSQDYIKVTKANVHNLVDVTVSIPKNTLTVITGPSGSGKSSLAFDTIYVEGQRRYIESLSSYARQFLGQYQAPDVESITGLSPLSP